MTNESIGLVLILTIVAPSVKTVSFMESLRSLVHSTRYQFDGNGISYPEIVDGVRRQQKISQRVPFPCDTKLGRSPSPPDDVHRLRPGDIDIVGGLGDSLVAGSGALEEFAIGTFIEARGVSWCAGGQGDWRMFLTVPNLIKAHLKHENAAELIVDIRPPYRTVLMLRAYIQETRQRLDAKYFKKVTSYNHNCSVDAEEFNRNLTGYATGTGEFISAKAALNVAFPVAATEDALHQARILVSRIKSNPKMDVRKHWKLITILFGANDICSAQCYSPKAFSPVRYALHLRRALDYLRAALPRTLVNLVPAIDVTVSVRVNRSMMCNILHPLYCACMHEGNRPDIAASKMARMYQQAAESLVASGRYDTTKDFAVVYQPFTKLFNAPNSDPRRAPPLDPNLVTYDCFHFSQRGHALGANLLWNNMLEPVGNKTDAGLPEILERMLCPTESRPYIFTNVNSRRYRETGSQEGIEPR